ncbi:hypothetical protein VQ643_00305 [Pseudomonas sp. F1_0610]|uniref:hypothetical protein n=1 Tax=Pseudomonas sp. F1_0610 TaxID=3114284 RepID=UPI0039C060CB
MVKKIKTELTYLKYESDWNRLDINFGSVIFKMSKDKIYIDETPYACNETLSEIFNLKLDDAGYLFFSVNSYKKKVIKYRLDCNTVAGAAELARCLISVHSGTMIRNSAYNDIDIVIKENNYYVAIGTRHLKLFLLSIILIVMILQSAFQSQVKNLILQRLILIKT